MQAQEAIEKRKEDLAAALTVRQHNEEYEVC